MIGLSRRRKFKTCIKRRSKKTKKLTLFIDMKKFLISLLLASSLVLVAFGEDLWFSWDKNPATEMISGYRLEYIKLPVVTNWTLLTTISGTTNVAVVKGAQGGYIYKFRMFAVNAKGIGTNLSNVIEIPTNAPTAVTNFNLTTPR